MDLFLQSVQEWSFMNELKYLFEIPAPGSVLQLLFETVSLSSKCVFGVTFFRHNSRHQRPATVAGCFKYTYCVGNIWGWETNNLPKLNIAPENGWLEDDPFLLGLGLCSWGELAVSFRESDRWGPVLPLWNLAWTFWDRSLSGFFQRVKDGLQLNTCFFWKGERGEDPCDHIGM